VNLGRIVGRVVATRKDEGLSGMKLLLVQPVGPDRGDRGRLLLATDAVGAGAGETVVYVRGREASNAHLPGRVPTDAGIVGVVDETFVDPEALPGRSRGDAGL
jgi:ethanolamine utilization protein EutN